MGSINDHRDQSADSAFHINLRRRQLRARMARLEQKVGIIEEIILLAAAKDTNTDKEPALRLAETLAGSAKAETERFKSMMQFLTGARTPEEQL